MLHTFVGLCENDCMLQAEILNVFVYIVLLERDSNRQIYISVPSLSACFLPSIKYLILFNNINDYLLHLMAFFSTGVQVFDVKHESFAILKT